MPLVPSPFLFRFTLPVMRIDPLPRTRPPLLDLPESSRVPFPSGLDGQETFAELRMAWNPRGLALAVEVSGKSDRPRCSPDNVLASDGVQISIDTRDTQSVHRATRFCHQFILLPLGGAAEDGGQPPAAGKTRPGGKPSAAAPFLKQLPVPRAREDAPEIDAESLLLEGDVRRDGYRVAVWFPTESLHGFDPETHPRLGFSLIVNDHDLGRQYLTVGEEFPVDADPSLWVSLELAGNGDDQSQPRRRRRRSPHQDR